MAVAEVHTSRAEPFAVIHSHKTVAVSSPQGHNKQGVDISQTKSQTVTNEIKILCKRSKSLLL